MCNYGGRLDLEPAGDRLDHQVFGLLGLFVLVVLFMPKGLVGVCSALYAKARPYLPAMPAFFGGRRRTCKRKEMAS